MDVKSMVFEYRKEIVKRLAELVAINSVEGTPTEDAPFGQGPKEALLAALSMMEHDGFTTVNLDNYIGYAEMGQGEQVIGVIGHLDVVPANQQDGWLQDPFTLSVDQNGTLYGRGVADDKGAVVAAMIAMNIIKKMDIQLDKRVRLIMGCNEETGSKCLKHYVEKEGHVDYGFTPDGDFPGVHGEKGMITMTYRCPLNNIITIQGGSAKNIVCQKVFASVKKNSYSNKKLLDYFNNNNLKYELQEFEDHDEITVYGKAAHGSTPELGINAMSHLFEAFKSSGLQDPSVEFYTSHFGLGYHGELMNCELEDEYGELTMVTSVISTKDGFAEGVVDLRYPVTMSSRKVLRNLEEHLEDENGVITIVKTKEPLFYAPDSPLVTSLLEAYQDVTHDMDAKPITMGGGTYAKGIHNCIAFGCAFPGVDYHIHDVNEFVPLDDLLLQAEIYVHAILKLLEI